MSFCAMSAPQGKTIILGITGGVAAYKAAELVRLCVKGQYAVQAVMTEAATRFVGLATFQALTARPVMTNMWGAGGDGMGHIHLSRHADMIVVAPASADFIAKLVTGSADDLLSTLCLARACPLVIAPAMNREMWLNPATQRNIAQLRKDGVVLVGPDEGDLACGETGLGRMSEPQSIFDAVERLSGPRLLSGKTVLITAGPTFERIDPVRGLTNLSSGKMGYALAQAAREAGAQVILVSGPVCLDTPEGVGRISVTTAQEMLAAVMARVRDAQLFISAAAVADFRPATTNSQKIKKNQQTLNLELLPNEDILAKVARLPNPPFCIGFAAETENLLENAETKRRNKRLPMLVANLAQTTLGADDAELVILDKQGAHPLPRADKLSQARRVIQHGTALIDQDLLNLSKSRHS
jgi:phosphopantothenoylcysteine decarboxylase / phosphopantothenate---cysteine ligase